MRTQEEIVDRIESLKGTDFFGFEVSELVSLLEYRFALPYLRTGTTVEIWEPMRDENTEASVRGEMKSYLEFAWDKAKNFRRISADRSMGHYRAWFWLLGDDEMVKALEHHEYYGKDHLVKITKFLGLNPADYDDGVRLNQEPG